MRKDQIVFNITKWLMVLVLVSTLGIIFVAIAHLSRSPYLGFELAPQPDSQPIGVGLLVRFSAKGSLLQPEDRILSVGGIPVNMTQLAAAQNLLQASVNPNLPIVFLRRGSVQLVIADQKSLTGLKTEIVYKFPVVVSSILVPERINFKPGDRLMAINDLPVWNNEQVQQYFSSLSFGQAATVYLRTEDEFRTEVLTIRYSYWDRNRTSNLVRLIFSVSGFLLTMFLIFRLKDHWLALRYAFLFLIMISLSIIDWQNALRGTNFSVSPLWTFPGIVLTPLAILIFACRYPTRLPNFWIHLAEWTGAGWTVLVLVALWSKWWTPQSLANGVKLGGIVTSCLLMIFGTHRFFSGRQPYEKGLPNLILLNSIIGLIGPFVGFSLPVVFPVAGRYPTSGMMLLIGVLLPLSLGYAYIREQFLYADVIFKKSLSYSLVSVVIIFFYFLVVVQFGNFLHQLLGIENIWVLLLFLLFAAFLIEPLKNLVSGLFDRLFYRHQVQYRQFVFESSRQMNYLMETPAIIDLTLNRICEVAWLGGGYISLKSESTGDFEFRAARNPETADYPQMRVLPSWKIISWLKETGGPIELYDRKQYKIFQSLPDVERELISRLGVHLLAPLISRGELLGILLLKSKLSGELYTFEDINFLGLLCNQAAMAIENASIREKEKAMLHSLYQQKHLALIGQMAASIAHEIRNPLVAVKGLGKLVEESLTAEDKRKQHLIVLNKEVERLQNVVSELVLFARPSPLRKERADLNSVVQGVLDLYQEQFAQGHYETIFTHQPEPIYSEVDTEKIRQVIINLIQNAMEANPNGGKIVVETTVRSSLENKPQAMCTVWDSGNGISTEFQDKVFEPFFTTKKSGAGLGLAIAREIIKEHDGQISIRPATLGGSLIEICLPVTPVGAG